MKQQVFDSRDTVSPSQVRQTGSQINHDGRTRALSVFRCLGMGRSQTPLKTGLKK